MTLEVQSLEKLRKQALQGGGETRIQKQHQKGKYTARERIDLLLDPGSFQEIGLFAAGPQSDGKFGDGVITGKGKINGRPIYLFAQDFTINGGSVGKVHGRKIRPRFQQFGRQKIVEYTRKPGGGIVQKIGNIGGFVNHRSDKIRFNHQRTAQVRVLEFCAAQLRPSQVCPGENGTC